MVKNKKQNNNKKKQYILASLAILLVIVGALTITGTLSLGSLFGGSETDSVGGYAEFSSSDLNGDATVSFSSLQASSVEIDITNNGDITSLQATKKLPLTFNSASTLTGYQKKFTLDYQTGMQADFADVRFQTTDGKNVPYWIESKVDSTSAVIWIKADFPIGDTVINCLYASGVTESDSDADAVFELYDGFDGTTLDTSKWSGSGTYSISDSKANMGGTATTNEYIISNKKFTPDSTYILEFNAQFSTSSAISNMGYWNIDVNDVAGFYTYAGSTVGYHTNTRNNNVVSQHNIGTSYDGYHTWKIITHASSVEYFIDDVLIHTETTNLPNEAMPIWLNGYDSNVNVDWVKVTKYTSSEPTLSVGTPTDFDTQFTKRQTVTITSSADLTDYQTKLSVPYDSDMQVDYNDLRFKTTTGKTIPHFIESYDGSNAITWIKSDLINGDTDIYMYYGNVDVNSESNGDLVFDKYYDFSSMPSDFTQLSGTWVADGTLHTTGINVYISSDWQFNYDDGIKFMYKYKIPDDYHQIAIGDKDADYKTQIGYVLSDTTSAISYYDTIATHPLQSQSVSKNIDDWSIIEFSRSPSNDYNINVDGVNIHSITNSYKPPNAYLKFRSYWVDTDDIEIDDLCVMKYISSEPTAVFGTEESFGSPEFTVSVTGDSDVHTYSNPELREITLTPTADIDEIPIVSNSNNYDYVAKVHFSQSATEIDETIINNESTFKSVQFTPIETIVDGYVNVKFEDVNFSNYTVGEISANLDDIEITNISRTNQTISLQVSNVDTSLHTANCTVAYSEIVEETPSTPSSSGGGGSSYVPPVVEETEIEDQTITESIDTTSEQLDKDEIIDILGDKTQASLIFMLFVAVGSILAILYRKR